MKFTFFKKSYNSIILDNKIWSYMVSDRIKTNKLYLGGNVQSLVSLTPSVNGPRALVMNAKSTVKILHNDK